MDSLSRKGTKRLPVAGEGIVPLDVILSYSQQQQDGILILFVGLTIVFWDYCLTFQDEVSFVWVSTPRFTFGKIVFFINRYLPPTTFLAHIVIRVHDRLPNRLEHLDICKAKLAREILGWLIVANFLTAEIMLLLCVWVLWGRRLRIGISLALLLVGSIIAATAIRNYHPPFLPFAELPPASLFPCGYQPPNPSVPFWLYIFGGLVQTVSFTMLLMRAWRPVEAGLPPWTITSVLRQYGFLYYAVSICVTSICVISTLDSAMFLRIYTGQYDLFTERAFNDADKILHFEEYSRPSLRLSVIDSDWLSAKFCGRGWKQRSGLPSYTQLVKQEIGRATRQTLRLTFDGCPTEVGLL